MTDLYQSKSKLVAKRLTNIDPNIHTTYTYGMTKLVGKYQPSILMIGATIIGRDFGPRLSCRLKTGLTADCTSLAVDPEDVYKRQDMGIVAKHVKSDVDGVCIAEPDKICLLYTSRHGTDLHGHPLGGGDPHPLVEPVRLFYIPLFIAGFPFGGIVAGLAPPDADELASGLQSGEAQLRQPFGDLGDKLFLFGLDAPVI